MDLVDDHSSPLEEYAVIDDGFSPTNSDYDPSHAVEDDSDVIKTLSLSVEENLSVLSESLLTLNNRPILSHNSPTLGLSESAPVNSENNFHLKYQNGIFKEMKTDQLINTERCQSKGFFSNNSNSISQSEILHFKPDSNKKTTKLLEDNLVDELQQRLEEDILTLEREEAKKRRESNCLIYDPIFDSISCPEEIIENCEIDELDLRLAEDISLLEKESLLSEITEAGLTANISAEGTLSEKLVKHSASKTEISASSQGEIAAVENTADCSENSKSSVCSVDKEHSGSFKELTNKKQMEDKIDESKTSRQSRRSSRSRNIKKSKCSTGNSSLDNYKALLESTMDVKCHSKIKTKELKIKRFQNGYIETSESERSSEDEVLDNSSKKRKNALGTKKSKTKSEGIAVSDEINMSSEKAAKSRPKRECSKEKNHDKVKNQCNDSSLESGQDILNQKGNLTEKELLKINQLNYGKILDSDKTNDDNSELTESKNSKQIDTNVKETKNNSIEKEEVKRSKKKKSDYIEDKSSNKINIELMDKLEKCEVEKTESEKVKTKAEATILLELKTVDESEVEEKLVEIEDGEILEGENWDVKVNDATPLKLDNIYENNFNVKLKETEELKTIQKGDSKGKCTKSSNIKKMDNNDSDNKLKELIEEKLVKSNDSNSQIKDGQLSNLHKSVLHEKLEEENFNKVQKRNSSIGLKTTRSSKIIKKGKGDSAIKINEIKEVEVELLKAKEVDNTNEPDKKLKEREEGKTVNNSDSSSRVVDDQSSNLSKIDKRVLHKNDKSNIIRKQRCKTDSSQVKLTRSKINKKDESESDTKLREVNEVEMFESRKVDEKNVTDKICNEKEGIQCDSLISDVEDIQSSKIKEIDKNNLGKKFKETAEVQHVDSFSKEKDTIQSLKSKKINKVELCEKLKETEKLQSKNSISLERDIEFPKHKKIDTIELGEKLMEVEEVNKLQCDISCSKVKDNIKNSLNKKVTEVKTMQKENSTTVRGPKSLRLNKIVSNLSEAKRRKKEKVKSIEEQNPIPTNLHSEALKGEEVLNKSGKRDSKMPALQDYDKDEGTNLFHVTIETIENDTSSTKHDEKVLKAKKSHGEKYSEEENSSVKKVEVLCSNKASEKNTREEITLENELKAKSSKTEQNYKTRKESASKKTSVECDTDENNVVEISNSDKASEKKALKEIISENDGKTKSPEAEKNYKSKKPRSSKKNSVDYHIDEENISVNDVEILSLDKASKKKTFKEISENIRKIKPSLAEKNPKPKKARLSKRFPVEEENMVVEITCLDKAKTEKKAKKEITPEEEKIKSPKNGKRSLNSNKNKERTKRKPKRFLSSSESDMSASESCNLEKKNKVLQVKILKKPKVSAFSDESEREEEKDEDTVQVSSTYKIGRKKKKQESKEQATKFISKNQSPQTLFDQLEVDLSENEENEESSLSFCEFEEDKPLSESDLDFSGFEDEISLEGVTYLKSPEKKSDNKKNMNFSSDLPCIKPCSVVLVRFNLNSYNKNLSQIQRESENSPTKLESSAENELSCKKQLKLRKTSTEEKIISPQEIRNKRKVKDMEQPQLENEHSTLFANKMTRNLRRKREEIKSQSKNTDIDPLKLMSKYKKVQEKKVESTPIYENVIVEDVAENIIIGSFDETQNSEVVDKGGGVSMGFFKSLKADDIEEKSFDEAVFDIEEILKVVDEKLEQTPNAKLQTFSGNLADKNIKESPVKESRKRNAQHLENVGIAKTFNGDALSRNFPSKQLNPDSEIIFKESEEHPTPQKKKKGRPQKVENKNNERVSISSKTSDVDSCMSEMSFTSGLSRRSLTFNDKLMNEPKESNSKTEPDQTALQEEDEVVHVVSIPLCIAADVEPERNDYDSSCDVSYLITPTPAESCIERTVTDEKNTLGEIFKHFSMSQEVRLEEDGDKMFLLSLLSDFRKIPDENKLDAKTEIIQTLKKWKSLASSTVETPCYESFINHSPQQKVQQSPR